MRIFEIVSIPDYKSERDWDNFIPYWLNDSYTVVRRIGPMEIRVYDNQGMIRIIGIVDTKIMAYLTLMRMGSYYSVQSVQVASQIRGYGVASYFYEIALKELRLTLVSDDVQTMGGAAIWKKLERMDDIIVDAIDINTNQTVDPNQTYSTHNIRLRARYIEKN